MESTNLTKMSHAYPQYRNECGTRPPYSQVCRKYHRLLGPKMNQKWNAEHMGCRSVINPPERIGWKKTVCRHWWMAPCLKLTVLRAPKSYNRPDETVWQTSVFCGVEIHLQGGAWHGNMTWWENWLTSSSFSGRPFNPPLGSCRSDNHQARVLTSTTSNRSRMARAATHTNTMYGD